MDAVTRHIDGHGISESQWQGGDWLQALPMQQAAALFATVARVVVVSPHPDDEVLACGGLMAEARRQGLPVMVISVTDGEACYPGQAQWPPLRLRQARLQELERALGCLGLAGAERHAWHFDDGAVAGSEAVLATRLQPLLRADDLVLAPWRLDAHPDHEAVGRACVRAAAARGCVLREFPVWGWHWVDPQAAQALWSPATRIALSAQARQGKHAAIEQFSTQRGAVAGLDCEPILPDAVVLRFTRDYEVLIG
ncbi:PIG-L family deacetylase [Bacillus subtilis subsp. subtilis]|nr:PIG-L family deacetylase [Bacillus subtilis subsp. subtilis]